MLLLLLRRTGTPEARIKLQNHQKLQIPSANLAEEFLNMKKDPRINFNKMLSSMQAAVRTVPLIFWEPPIYKPT